MVKLCSINSNKQTDLHRSPHSSTYIFQIMQHIPLITFHTIALHKESPMRYRLPFAFLCILPISGVLNARRYIFHPTWWKNQAGMPGRIFGAMISVVRIDARNVIKREARPAWCFLGVKYYYPSVMNTRIVHPYRFLRVPRHLAQPRCFVSALA